MSDLNSVNKVGNACASGLVDAVHLLLLGVPKQETIG